MKQPRASAVPTITKHTLLAAAATGLILMGLSGCGWGVAATVAAVSHDDDDEPPSPHVKSIDPLRVCNSEPFDLKIYGTNLGKASAVYLEAPDGTQLAEAVDTALVVTPGRILVSFGSAGELADYAGLANVVVEVRGTTVTASQPLHICVARPVFTTSMYEAPDDAGDIAALDYDGDGHKDIVTVNRSTSTVRFLRGNGDGTLSPGPDFDTPTYALSVAAIGKDVVEDALGEAVAGIAGDAAAVATVETVLLVFLNVDGDTETLQGLDLEMELPPTSEERHIVVGSFDEPNLNEEGPKNDILVTSKYDDTFAVCMNLDTTYIIPIAEIRSTYPQESSGLDLVYPADVAMADFNADGTDDIVVATQPSSRIDFFLSAIDGDIFVHAGSYAISTDPVRLVAGNLHDPQHNDEFPDALVAKKDGDVRPVFVLGVCDGGCEAGGNEGLPELRLTAISRAAPMGVDPADMLLADIGGPHRRDQGDNEVSVPDLITANWNDQAVSVAVTPRIGLGNPLIIPMSGNPRALASADFDEDGADDVAVLTNDTTEGDSVTILLREPIRQDPIAFPTIYLPYSARPTFEPNLTGIDLLPLQPEGRTGLVLLCQGTDEVAVLTPRPDNDSYYPLEFFSTGGYGARAVRCAAMDDDAYVDVVVTHRISVHVTILYNDGSDRPKFYDRDVFDLEPLTEDYMRPRVLDVKDLDKDGDQDILIPVTFADTVIILWNMQNGPHDIPEEERPLSQYRILEGRSGRTAFEPQILRGIGPNPRTARGADLNRDDHMDAVIACETRSSADTGELEDPGGVFILWNTGNHRFERTFLPMYGLSCPDHFSEGRHLGDEAEFAVGACITSAPNDNRFLDIPAAFKDVMGFYSPLPEKNGLYPQYSETARWVRVYDSCSDGKCEMEPCVCRKADPESVLAYDLNGDGWLDLISVDESFQDGQINVLINTTVESSEIPCISNRFELVQTINAYGPQGVRVFPYQGTHRLAVIHRKEKLLTLHDWTADGRFKLVHNIKIAGPSAGMRNSVAHAGDLLCFVKEEAFVVQPLKIADLAADPGRAWWPTFGSISTAPYVPVAVAMCAESDTAEDGACDLIIGAWDVEEEKVPHPLRLYVLPSMTTGGLPAENQVLNIGDLAPAAEFAGERWVALQVLNQESGGSLIAATDRDIWLISRTAGGGLGKPLEPLTAGSNDKITDAVCGDLNGDGHADLVAARSTGESGSEDAAAVVVAFGPLDAPAVPWQDLPEEVRIPNEVACCGVGRAPIRGEEHGLLVIADPEGAAEIVSCDAAGAFRKIGTCNVGKEPADIRFGDLNLDTVPDLVVANRGPGTFAILPGSGDDTEADPVVANRGPGTFTILAGSGDGTFEVAGSYPTGVDAEAILVLRIDDDPYDDLVVATSQPGLQVAMNRSVKTAEAESDAD